jgi:hypothetical protein
MHKRYIILKMHVRKKLTSYFFVFTFSTSNILFLFIVLIKSLIKLFILHKYNAYEEGNLKITDSAEVL